MVNDDSSLTIYNIEPLLTIVNNELYRRQLVKDRQHIYS